MDLKIIAAVLVVLLIVGVGLETYDKEVRDFTDISEIFGGLRGIFDTIDVDEEPRGDTEINVNFVDQDEGSKIDYEGYIDEIEILGDGISINFSTFSSEPTYLEVANYTGDFVFGDRNATFDGEATNVTLVDNELVSEERESVSIDSYEDQVVVENITNVDMEFKKADGTFFRDNQTIELQETKLKLQDFTGMYLKDFGGGTINLEGVVSRAEIGEEGSKTVVGD